MKRILFFMICGLFVLMSFARNGEVTEVPMTHIGGNDKQAIIFPEVVYSANDNELIVAFDATESYTLQVKDASGVTQYSTPIVTDGNEYSYPVNLAPHAYYVVTIYSTTNTFSGVLFTP